jgi:multidrug transporter EmrE-like cation transporter
VGAEEDAMRLPPLVVLFIAIGLGGLGQVSLKHGVGLVRQFGPLGVGTLWPVVRAIFTPYILLGFLLYALSSILWLAVLQQKQLSYLYPMIAAGYVLVVVLSWLFFRENIGWLRLMGLVVICVGVVLVARS